MFYKYSLHTVFVSMSHYLIDCGRWRLAHIIVQVLIQVCVLLHTCTDIITHTCTRNHFAHVYVDIHILYTKSIIETVTSGRGNWNLG
jgi:hypothetical protein